MTRPGSGAARRRMLWALALAAALLGAALWQGTRTIAWGNALYRVGAFRAAGAAYRGQLARSEGAQAVAFNLGTALLRTGSDEAERFLERATAGADHAIAQRAHYNLGYRLLTLSEGSTDQVSGVALLLAAIRNYRAALRLDPTDEDARWNLALAQRRYEAFASIYEEGPAATPREEETGSPPESEDRSGRAPGVGSGADRAGSAADDPGDEEGGGPGAREALLGEGDPGPLGEREARRLLDTVTDDPTLLVRGVLWSQRPRPD